MGILGETDVWREILGSASSTTERRRIMSLECACVYWDSGKCKKFSDDKVTSWCVESPCEYQMPSKADRIRAMSDEELAEFLESTHTNMAIKLGDEFIVRAKEYIEIWLKQPAEVD